MKRELKFIIVLLLSMFTMVQAQTTRVGPFFYVKETPATKPSGFQDANHILVNTTAQKTYRWVSGAWTEFDAGLYKPGPAGPAGPQGEQGPQGSGGTGVGFPVVYGRSAFPTNQAEYLNAVRMMANGSIRNITLFNDIVITQDYEIPDTITGNQTKRGEINFNNYALIDGSTNGLKSLLPRRPDDQNEALNVMQSWSFYVHNGYLRGKGSLTKTAIDLGATYNSVISDLQLDNFYDGIVVRFCLMATIRNIMINGVTNNAIMVTRGNWPGVGTANAQSNHTLVEQCRIFNVDNANSAFYVENASGVILRQCISEGNKPKYHVLWNSLGSTVCKDGWIFTLHLESGSYIAAIKALLAGGFLFASGNFSQYDNVLYDVESSLGYPHMYVENVPWMTGGSKLKTTGTSVIWAFKEVAFDPNNSALWVNSYKPYYWYQEGFNQSYFEKGNHLSTTAAKMVGQPWADWDVEYSPSEVVILKEGNFYASRKFTKEADAFAFYSQINTEDLKKGIIPK